MRYHRQNYQDIALSSVDPLLHPICQLKYDGIWCLADSQSDGVSYFSRHGSLKHKDNHTSYQGAFIGEFMYGSEWAKEKPGREGQFFVFDMIEDNQADLKNTSYLSRYSRLQDIFLSGLLPQNFQLVSNFPTTSAIDIWHHLIDTQEFEGLVFRNPLDLWDTTLPRAKYSLTKDLYICGFEEGKTGKNISNLGALICTESPVGVGVQHIIGGGLTDKQRRDIWQNQSDYLGRCITVEAKKVFRSGQLRHPQFKNFHLEK